jgi:hypothetical protein
MADVIFVVPRNLSRVDYERFGVGFFSHRGNRVTVIDLQDQLHPVIENKRDHYASCCGVKFIIPRSKLEFELAFKNIRENSLIIFLAQCSGFTFQNAFALRAVSRTNAPYLILSVNNYPGFDPELYKQSFVSKIRKAFKHLSEIRWLDSLYSRLPIKVAGIRHANFIVYGGKESATPNNLVTSRTRSLFAHSMDYDNFLRSKHHDNYNIDTQQKQAVFLDQFLPFHPGFKEKRGREWIDPEHYFDCLDHLFNKIEEQLKLDVVILAHPRADYFGKEHYYRSRKVVYGNTVDFVKNAKLVITHQSVATSYAILFDCPILPIAYRSHYNFNGHFQYVYHRFSEAIKKDFQFIDGDVDITNAMSINKSAYQKYKTDFIKLNNTPDNFFWNIVCDEVAYQVSINLGAVPDNT